MNVLTLPKVCTDFPPLVIKPLGSRQRLFVQDVAVLTDGFCQAPGKSAGARVDDAGEFFGGPAPSDSSAAEASGPLRCSRLCNGGDHGKEGLFRRHLD